MNLKIVAFEGLLDIATEEKDGANAFAYARMVNMYRAPAGGQSDGVGCQVNDESRRADIEALGEAIAKALTEFGRKYPDSGILGKRSLSIASA